MHLAVMLRKLYMKILLVSLYSVLNRYAKICIISVQIIYENFNDNNGIEVILCTTFITMKSNNSHLVFKYHQNHRAAIHG